MRVPTYSTILTLGALVSFTWLDRVTASSEATAQTLPFTLSPFQASDIYELSPTKYGNCIRGNHDAQYTDDPVCRTVDECNLGWTQAGEYLIFDFIVTPDDFVFDYYNYEEVLAVDVTIRIASANPNKRVQLGIYHYGEPEGEWPETMVSSPGEDWQGFRNVVWRNVRLPIDESDYELFVGFPDGFVNICSVSVRPARYAALEIPALDFDDYHEVDPEHQFGVCGNGLVDAQPTSDWICQNRDGSKCNIGWTEPGEWVAYDFTTIDSEDYDVWVRVASAIPGQRIRVELTMFDNPLYPAYYPFVNGTYSEEFDVPDLGWQEFVDLGFQLYLESEFHFRLTVYFDTGHVNLCSVRVAFTHHWASEETVPPLSFNAVKEWSDSFGEEDLEVVGSCPDHNPPVDANQVASDAECLASGPCYVGFTSPGEILRYDFSTESTGSEILVNVRIRVASHSPARTILLELDGNRQYFAAPGNGWESFSDIEWNNLPTTSSLLYHSLYITFVDGGVNLCLVEITPA